MSDLHNAIYQKTNDTSDLELANNLSGGGGGSTATIVVNNSTNDLTGASIVLKYGATVISTTNHIGDNIQVGAIGVYTIECGVYSVDVTVTALGAIVYADVNTTDSWKLWVEAGGLDADDYNDLVEVLADEKAIRQLMTKHASVDFLANSNKNATLISTIINDNYCAKWINLRDYALDTLYANEDIAELMDTADKYFYGEWVITDSTTTPPTWGAKGNVPVMTSNTAPYGEVSASSEYSSEYSAWYAFDQDPSTKWASTSADTLPYIQYKFTNPVCVRRIDIQNREANVSIISFKISGSNDGTNWTDIYSDSIKSTDPYYINKYNFDNSDYYLYYRVTETTPYPSSTTWNIASLQFYGRELKVSVPTMTSNTAPYGEAFSEGNFDSRYAAYMAFDKDETNSFWASSVDSGDKYIGYSFNYPVIIKQLRITHGWVRIDVTKVILQGSNDGFISDVNDIKILSPSTGTFNITIEGIHQYKTYRVIFNTTNGANNSYVFVNEAQFYGLDYSEYDWDTEHPRHYIYDHGVELEDVSIMDGVTKETDNILIQGSSSAATVAYIQKDLSDYILVRVANDKVIGADKGVIYSTASVMTTTTTLEAYNGMNNPPYHNYLDVSAINATRYISVGERSSSTLKNTISEWWLE